jgi:hypothetical protein
MAAHELGPRELQWRDDREQQSEQPVLAEVRRDDRGVDQRRAQRKASRGEGEALGGFGGDRYWPATLAT